MLMEILAGLEGSALAAGLRGSKWVYPLVNAGHIAGIALLFGAIAGFDLRLMGAWPRVPREASGQGPGSRRGHGSLPCRRFRQPALYRQGNRVRGLIPVPGENVHAGDRPRQCYWPTGCFRGVVAWPHDSGARPASRLLLRLCGAVSLVVWLSSSFSAGSSDISKTTCRAPTAGADFSPCGKCRRTPRETFAQIQMIGRLSPVTFVTASASRLSLTEETSPERRTGRLGGNQLCRAPNWFAHEFKQLESKIPWVGPSNAEQPSRHFPRSSKAVATRPR